MIVNSSLLFSEFCFKNASVALPLALHDMGIK